jgi:dTDP-4-amino-4,6-dideoxygalactose transaminase
LAIGTSLDGTHAGLLGDVGCFSFYPVKHMTTAEGGMIITRHDELAHRVERQRAFGVDRTPAERSMPGIYDVTELGFNYRMNEIEAAIGVEQLKKMKMFLEKRRENFDALAAAVNGIPGVSTLRASSGGRQSSYYCLSALLDPQFVDKRPDIVARLKERGVGTSVYYPAPVPRLTYYRERYGYSPDQFPVAARLSDASIALPVGPHLTTDDMAFIGEAVGDAMKEVSP